MKHLLVILLLMSLLRGEALAYTGTPGSGTLTTDGSSSDVAAALDDAQAGDSVVIPSGTFNWSAQLGSGAITVASNVTLIGAGTSALGGGDQTIIVDQYNSGTTLLAIVVPATGVFRMTGITFRDSSNYGDMKQTGVIRIDGPGSVRIDHVHFDYHTDPAGATKPIWIGNLVYGVVHDCIMSFVNNTSIYVGNGAGADGKGNQVWAEATGFGGANFIFFEDNLFRATADFPDLPIRIADVYSGGRTVWRFNTIQSGSGLEVHDTGHSGDDRGARASEGYGNSFEAVPGMTTPPFDMARISSGAVLIWGNSNAAENLKNILRIDAVRRTDAVGGTYDQDATPDGWGYAGTQFNGVGSNWDGGTYNGTDTLRGYPNIDQAGRGIGDLLTGSFPTKVNSTTGTIAWPNQALEPVYFWANTGLTPHSGYGGAVYSNASDSRVVADRDYYQQASGIQTTASSPFNGTTGTGWGTLANRPTTCTTGVAYWATDQGSWNQSTSNPRGVPQNGADGVLYKATATNTWTLYYTPYTYPHPLRGNTTVSLTTLNVTNLVVQ